LHRIIVGIKNYKYIVTIPPERWQKVYEKASSERLNPLGLQGFYRLKHWPEKPLAASP